MILSIDDVVYFVLYILGCGLIFGLLFYLIGYVEQNFPSIQPFARFARIGLMIMAVLVLIGIILAFMGHPIVRFK